MATKTAFSDDGRTGRVPSVWAGAGPKARLACLIAYAGVFEDAIRISGLEERMPDVGPGRIEAALRELASAGRIVVSAGWAALPGLEPKIARKEADLRRARDMILSKEPLLKLLGRLPIVKFVGISGSLAAGNPVEDADGRVDVDVFVITRSQCLWLFFIPLALWLNLPGREPGDGLCVNLVMDGSDVSVYNRNFFIASEIRNLVPVAGDGAHREFLRRNAWVNGYFDGLAGEPDGPRRPGAWEVVNKTLYVVYHMLRGLKNLSAGPLGDISFRANGLGAKNFNRVGASYGGYQAVVYRSFLGIRDRWFPDLIDDGLVERLFPDDLSAAIRAGGPAFDEILAKTGLQRANYGKYLRA